jgi:hypothetical protein
MLVPLYGEEINYTLMEKSVSFHLGQSGVTREEIGRLLDAM